MEPSNVLNIESLTEGWRDKDSVILHACFQVVKDFVEKEPLFKETIDIQDEKRKLASQEVLELYNWWLSYEEKDIPERKDYQIENQMLKRLIDLRWVMWT